MKTPTSCSIAMAWKIRSTDRSRQLKATKDIILGWTWQDGLVLYMYLLRPIPFLKRLVDAHHSLSSPRENGVPNLIAKNPLGSRLSSHGLHCRGSRSPKSRRPNWAWKLWRPHWPWCFCAPVPPDGAHQAQHPRYAGSLHRTWNQNCEGMKPRIWVPLQAMLSCGDDLKQAAKHSQNSTEWRTPQLPAMGKLDQEDQLCRLHACVFCRHTCWEIKDIKVHKGIFMNNIMA